jgi:hypothetical protein
MKKINPEEIELTPYEEEIEREVEAGNYELVENFEEWKKRLQEMARETKRALRKKELILEFESPETKEKALEILKKHLGESFKIIGA